MLLAWGAGAAAPARALDVQLELLPNPSAFTPAEREALERAAGLWEAAFVEPIAVRVQVRWTSPLSNLGHLAEIDLRHTRHPLARVRQALLAGAGTAAEAGALADLPGADLPLVDVNGARLANEVELTSAHARALGLGEGPARIRGVPILSSAATPLDGRIELNQDLRTQFDPDPGDGIDPARYDLTGVVAHELGHVLGFWSLAERLSRSGADPLPPHAADLFRFAGTGGPHDLALEPRQLAAGAAEWQDVLGGPIPLSEGVLSEGSFAADARHFRDDGGHLMDPVIPTGVVLGPDFIDRLVLDRLGWDSVDDPCDGVIETPLLEPIHGVAAEAHLDFFDLASLAAPPTGPPFTGFDPLPAPGLLPPVPPAATHALRMALDFGLQDFSSRSFLGFAEIADAAVDPSPAVLPAGDPSTGIEFLERARPAWAELPARVLSFEALSQSPGGTLVRLVGVVSSDGAPAQALGDGGRTGFRLTGWLLGEGDDVADDLDGVVLVDWVPEADGVPLETGADLLAALLQAAPGGASRIDVLDRIGLGLPPACANGEDDDGDGRVDLAEDPGCSGAADDSERDVDILEAAWAPALRSPEGLSLVWVESEATSGGGGPVQRNCFQLANGNADVASLNARVEIDFRRGECSGEEEVWPAAVGTPGAPGDVAATCVAIGPGRVEMEADSPLGFGEKSDVCCFEFAAVAPDGLPARGDLWAGLFDVDGSTSTDEEALLDDDDGPLGGSSCGLVGLELLAVALGVRAGRRARRRWSAGRRPLVALGLALVAGLALPGTARAVCLDLSVLPAPDTAITATLHLEGVRAPRFLALSGSVPVEVRFGGTPGLPTLESVAVASACPEGAPGEIQVSPASWAASTLSSDLTATLSTSLLLAPRARSLPLVGGLGVTATREANSNLFSVALEGGLFSANGLVDEGGSPRVVSFIRDYGGSAFGSLGINHPSCRATIRDPASRGFCPRATFQASPGARGGVALQVTIPVRGARWLVSDLTPIPYLDVEGTLVLAGELAACADGLDGDGDGLVDGDDPGCSGPADDSERDPALPCDDGIDNDGDGETDFVADADGDGVSDPPGDPGCRDPAWPQEDSQCQDGLDNDGMVGTDFDGGLSVLGEGGVDPDGADPQCGVPWRNKEKAGSCALGPEAALAGALLGLARRRRRARPRDKAERAQPPAEDLLAPHRGRG